MTFVPVGFLANQVQCWSPVFVSFLAISLEPPQIMTKSFLVNFSVSKFIAEVIVSGIALDFEIPKTPYELPRWLQASPNSLLCDYHQ